MTEVYNVDCYDCSNITLKTFINTKNFPKCLLSKRNSLKFYKEKIYITFEFV